MGNNKIVYGDEVLVDLTADTVAADVLLRGVTAHNAAGDPVTGTAVGGTCIPFVEVQCTDNSTLSGSVPELGNLYDGQTVRVWLSEKCQGVHSLELILADGSSTGAIPCYSAGFEEISSSVEAGSVLLLTYRANAEANGISRTGWWLEGISSASDRVSWTVPVTCGTEAICKGSIIACNNGKYFPLTLSSEFDLTLPLLCAGENLSPGETGTENYLTAEAKPDGLVASFVAGMPVFLRGTVSGAVFTVSGNKSVVQNAPQSEDGCIYLLLGTAKNEESLFLLPEHPLFAFRAGAFRRLDSAAVVGMSISGKELTLSRADGTSDRAEGELCVDHSDVGGCEKADCHPVSAVSGLEKRLDDLRIVSSASGEFISINDAAERHLYSLKLHGKTVQSGVPAPDAPLAPVSTGEQKPIKISACGKNMIDMQSLYQSNNDTVVEYSDNTISVYNTVSNLYRGARSAPMYLTAGTVYSLSAELVEYQSSHVRIGLRNEATNVFVAGSAIIFPGTGRFSVTFSPSSDMCVYLSALVTWSKAEIGSAVFRNIQLEVSSEATEYETYCSYGAVTCEPLDGLRGIPAESGGCYTDSKGTSWICDEMDLSAPAFVRRIGRMNTADVAGVELVSKGEASGNLYLFNIADADAECTCGISSTRPVVMPENPVFLSYNEFCFAEGMFGGVDVYFMSDAEDVESALEIITSEASDIYYVLAEPIYGTVQSSTVSQYRTLMTAQKNSVFMSESGAEMELLYVPDNTAALFFADLKESVS